MTAMADPMAALSPVAELETTGVAAAGVAGTGTGSGEGLGTGSGDGLGTTTGSGDGIATTTGIISGIGDIDMTGVSSTTGGTAVTGSTTSGTVVASGAGADVGITPEISFGSNTVSTANTYVPSLQLIVWNAVALFIGP